MGSERVINGDVFQIAINHKKNNDTYAYAVLLDKTAEEVDAFSMSNIVQVLTNTEDMHIVHYVPGNVYGVVFYKEGTARLDQFDITVSAPCILMLKEFDGNSLTCYYSDPTQNNQSVDVVLSRGNAKLFSGTLHFPQEEKGSSLACQFHF